jgi:hypothetical protein
MLVPPFGNDGLWAAFMALMLARAAALALYLPRIGRDLLARSVAVQETVPSSA